MAHKTPPPTSPADFSTLIERVRTTVDVKTRRVNELRRFLRTDLRQELMETGELLRQYNNKRAELLLLASENEQLVSSVSSSVVERRKMLRELQEERERAQRYVKEVQEESDALETQLESAINQRSTLEHDVAEFSRENAEAIAVWQESLKLHLSPTAHQRLQVSFTDLNKSCFLSMAKSGELRIESADIAQNILHEISSVFNVNGEFACMFWQLRQQLILAEAAK